MSVGSEFHAAGPACEKACSSNLIRSRGVTVSQSQASMCCCTAGRTDDVFEIHRASASAYSVNDRAFPVILCQAGVCENAVKLLIRN